MATEHVTGGPAPPPAALAWVAGEIAPGSRVIAVEGLPATAHATHAITVLDPARTRHRVVLRRWTRPGWRDDDPGFTPAHEAEVLLLLADGAVPSPRLLAVDADGTKSGCPAVLMSVVPGEALPGGVIGRAHLAELARSLHAIHALPVRADQVKLGYRRYYEPQRLQPPEWGRDGAVWREALELISAPPEASPGCLLHRDYHPGNTLWQGSRLSGLVDWAQASWGPPQLDVAHLRWNLALDHGVEVADLLLAEYRGLAGGGDSAEQAYWDIVATYDVVPELAPALVPAAGLLALEQLVRAALGNP